MTTTNGERWASCRVPAEVRARCEAEAVRDGCRSVSEWLRRLIGARLALTFGPAAVESDPASDEIDSDISQPVPIG